MLTLRWEVSLRDEDQDDTSLGDLLFERIDGSEIVDLVVESAEALHTRHHTPEAARSDQSKYRASNATMQAKLTQKGNLSHKRPRRKSKPLVRVEEDRNARQHGGELALDGGALVLPGSPGAASEHHKSSSKVC